MLAGILSIDNPAKGLWRDTEALVWALEQSDIASSVFCVSRFPRSHEDVRAAAAQAPPFDCPAAPAGQLLPEWLREIDLLISCEVFIPVVHQLVAKQGKRAVFVPNLDGARLDHDGADAWVRAVRESRAEVWAKTPMVQRTLQSMKIASELVPWSIPDPVVWARDARDRTPVRFAMNAGRGGRRRRRGTDIALRAFAKLRAERDDVELVVKSIPPLERLVDADTLEIPGVKSSHGFAARGSIDELYREADVVVYPSRWEGFGLSLLEALHAGAPVVATNGWPMSELIEHGHNGLLVDAKRMGDVRLAPWWECDPEGLASQMARIANNWRLRHRLTCPCPGELVARQHAFVERVRQRVLGQRSHGTTTGASNLWDKRARARGRLGVGHVSWSPSDLERVTAACWAIFRPALPVSRTRLRALDFGCGVGRFTELLRDAGLDVTGVDASTEMLEVARRDHPEARYLRVATRAKLPFDDGSFDLVFTCTVLQHVLDADFENVIQRLRRVLRVKGHALLFENTHPHSSRSSRSGHVVFRKEEEYLRAFPGVEVIGRLTLEGERHTLFAGVVLETKIDRQSCETPRDSRS